MNKKAQFVAILSLFFVLGLIAISFYLSQGTSEVVEMYYTPEYILKQDSEIKEYFFDLDQKVKYSSFKAFRDLCESSGFYDKQCEAWGGKCNPTLNLKESFRSHFVDYFLKADDFDVSIEINENNRFVISGKYKKGEKIFELPNYVKTEVPVEFDYVLNYDVSIFEDLYYNCRVLSCDRLGKCPISKNECSSGDNYIKIEKVLESNDFIEPKISFILKFEKLEG